jgi:hypothetical protein
VYSAHPNSKTDTTEPVKSSESVWEDLDIHVRERALRILSDLCYAYITAEADCALDNNNSEFERMNKNETAS